MYVNDYTPKGYSRVKGRRVGILVGNLATGLVLSAVRRIGSAKYCGPL
jgi:hypothetical protein